MKANVHETLDTPDEDSDDDKDRDGEEALAKELEANVTETNDSKISQAKSDAHPADPRNMMSSGKKVKVAHVNFGCEDESSVDTADMMDTYWGAGMAGDLSSSDDEDFQ